LVIVGFAMSLASGCGGAEGARGTASEAEASDVRPARAISGREARQLVAAGAVLLDVRSSTEYAIRHLDGAINVPVDELAARSTELDPEVPVVVYCVSGHRSANAGRVLRSKGFEYVFDLGSMASY